METKQLKFVVGRANGNTFEVLAKQLTVSKTTLVKWSKDFCNEIANEKYEIVSKLVSEYEDSKTKRIKYIVSEMKRVKDEIQTRDIKTIPFKDLISYMRFLNELRASETNGIRYFTGETLQDFDIDFLPKPETLTLE